MITGLAISESERRYVRNFARERAIHTENPIWNRAANCLVTNAEKSSMRTAAGLGLREIMQHMPASVLNLDDGIELVSQKKPNLTFAQYVENG
jgi:hypothetical protein